MRVVSNKKWPTLENNRENPMIHANQKQKKGQFKTPDLSFGARVSKPKRLIQVGYPPLLTTCNSCFYFRTWLFNKLE